MSLGLLKKIVKTGVMKNPFFMTGENFKIQSNSVKYT